MIENIKKVTNPLTIIAIFAGLSEISGTAVAPFLSEANQGKYIWFLISFPAGLVLLFFGVLLFKHHVLYAPSDYQSDAGFFRAANIKDNTVVVAEGLATPADVKPINF